MKPATFTFMALIAGLAATSANAEMVLSQVIVDLHPGKPPRDDIEVWNDSAETLYVAAEPSVILAPGTPDERREAAMRPEESGLLVSPQRLVLAPGERRTIRIAAVGQRPQSDRVYRVAIKPVAGAVSSEESALKVFVGYDTLVIVRPDNVVDDVRGERTGQLLVLRNEGNTSLELFDGQQCDSAGSNCQSLPAKRLYPGAAWEQTLPYQTKISYKSALGQLVRQLEF